MKHFRSFLFALSLFCLSLNTIGQEVGINILQQPAIMSINSTGTIRVDICNNDPSPINVPAHKLRPKISVPTALVKITGVTGLPAGWIICSNTGGTITLSNGTDNTLESGDCRTFFINVASGIVTGEPLNIASTLFFGGGTSATGCSNGPQTPGNVTGNDGSGTSVGVENLAGPMPIKQLDLSAALNGEKVDIKWITTDELNVNNFEVERSTDGVSFSKVATTKAVGNTTGKTTYKHIDDIHAITSSVVYYRIKVIDNDRSYYYSKIVSVSLNREAAIMAWPNPFIDRVNIKIDPRTKGKAVIKLYSNNGMLVKQKEVLVFSGTNFITLDGLAQLPKEAYAIDVRINNEKVYTGIFVK